MLNKVVTIRGYCPTLGQEKTIEVTYLGYSSLEGAEGYTRGKMKCDVAANDCPHREKCPLLAKAPADL